MSARQGDRGAAPGKHKIALHWAEAEPEFVWDLGQPACFACGWTPPMRERQTGDLKSDFAALWQRAKLDIAHIVPHMLNGPAEASNLVLLCKACHHEAPSFRDPEVMIRWMRDRTSWMETFEEIVDFSHLGELAARPGFGESFTDGSSFAEYYRRNAGYSNAETHTARMRTLLAAINGFAAEQEVKRERAELDRRAAANRDRRSLARPEPLTLF